MKLPGSNGVQGIASVTSDIKMGRKCDLTDFGCVVIVELRICEIWDLLGFSWEWSQKPKKKSIFEMQFRKHISLVDERLEENDQTRWNWQKS